MHLQLSIFVLKIAPGEILSSADKWEVNTTRAIELLSRKSCTTVQARRVVAACASFEAPSSRTD